MNKPTIIHCLCQRGTWHRVIGIILPDGRLEMRNDGKSSVVSGGRVELSCERCGFDRQIVLDKQAPRVLA